MNNRDFQIDNIVEVISKLDQASTDLCKASSSCTSALPQPAFSAADILKTLEEAMGAMQPDPLAAEMKKHGFDPMKGGRLVVRDFDDFDFGVLGPPYYVRQNPLVDEGTAMLMVDPTDLRSFLNPEYTERK